LRLEEAKGAKSALEVEDPEARAFFEKTKWRLRQADHAGGFLVGLDPMAPLAEVAQASRGAGFLTLFPDGDGVVRRLPLIVQMAEGFYPSFVLAAVCAYLEVAPERVSLHPGSIRLENAIPSGPQGLRDLVIPVDAKGCMRIRFAGPWGSMKHYSFADIFSAPDDPERFELWEEELAGKIVLVSDISTGSADIGQVPIDEAFPLSGVHANALNTILGGHFIRETAAEARVAVEFLLLSAVAALSLHRSILVFSLGAAGLAAGVAGGAGLALVFGNFMFPAARSLVIIGLAWAALLTLRAVETARARAATEKARQVFEKELEIGRKIQMGFLPGRIPVPAGWEITAHFQPALQVSGDFYDVFELGGGRFTGVVIADVCDHGVGSALFMALVRSLVRAFALQGGRDPGPHRGDAAAFRTALALDTVRQSNAYISETHGETGMFATLFIGILEPESGVLTYVNAGHEPPIHIRAGHPPEWIKATGLAVGALPDSPFRAETLLLAPGDRLVLYTDGITDAEDEAGRRLSRERVAQTASACTGGAGSLVDEILAVLNRHVGAGAPADDVTLLSIRRKAE
jgi:serine phosphatase RsbU (regulator of sigma subunit)